MSHLRTSLSYGPLPKGTPSALGDLPIRVISGQLADPFGAKIRVALERAHRQTAEQNAGAVYVAAHESAHMIPLTEPGLIASETIALFTPSAR